MSRTRRMALGLALAALVGLLIWATRDPAAVAQGWLVAAAALIGIPVGSLVLILVHALTGGRWGEKVAPVLGPTARLVWLGAAALALVGLDLPAAFPWAAGPSDVPADVAAIYLNRAAFAARSVLVLGGWTLLALRVERGLTPLGAALGLVFYGVAVSLFSVDWMLSVEPGYPSSAFPAGIAVQQIVAALAWAALAAPDSADERTAGDLGGLLMAGILGVLYLDFMTYLVAWYGNLPDKAAWFLRRVGDGWTTVLIAALVFGAAAPLALLLGSQVRRSVRMLRIVGALVLIGIVLRTTWLMAPAFAAASVWAEGLALAVLAGFGVFLAAPGDAAPRGRAAHAG